MQVRRALLLSAIVLGFLALAATLSQPPRRDAKTAPAPVAGELRPPVRLALSANGRPRTLRLEAGAVASLTVEVPEAGQVELKDPPLLSAADATTPAVFPLRIERPGRYPVLVTPAASGEQRRAGTVVVER